MELQPLKTVELHGWVCLPDSMVRKRVNLHDWGWLQMNMCSLIHENLKGGSSAQTLSNGP